jgi:hypothetical protein
LRGSWSSTSCCLYYISNLWLQHFDTHENGIIIPLISPSVIEPTETPHFRCWNLNVSWARPQTKPQLPASVICDSDVELHWRCFGYTDLRYKGCPKEAPWTEDPYNYANCFLSWETFGLGAPQHAEYLQRFHICGKMHLIVSHVWCLPQFLSPGTRLLSAPLAPPTQKLGLVHLICWRCRLDAMNTRRKVNVPRWASDFASRSQALSADAPPSRWFHGKCSPICVYCCVCFVSAVHFISSTRGLSSQFDGESRHLAQGGSDGVTIQHRKLCELHVRLAVGI